jgi:hypothetical protein|tara:strand:+ start:338 stop:505 length:168 start_codon:yes stop_codon:yes gene_type:complete
MLDDMNEKIDLSLNRSLEEMVNSFFMANNYDGPSTEREKNDLTALEDYLSGMDAI